MTSIAVSTRCMLAYLKRLLVESYACYSTSGMATDASLYSLLKDSEQVFEVSIRSPIVSNLT